MPTINITQNAKAIFFDGTNADEVLDAAVAADEAGQWEITSSSPTELVLQYVSSNWGDTRTATLAVGDGLLLMPSAPTWVVVPTTAADFAINYREQT